MKSVSEKVVTIALIAIVSILAVVVSMAAVVVSGRDDEGDVGASVGAWNRYASEDDILAEYSKLTGIDRLSAEHEEYAGFYFDDLGRAVIGFRKSGSDAGAASIGKEPLVLTASDGYNKIVVRYVKYSKAELEEARDTIRTFAPDVGEFKMIEMCIDYQKNKVGIGVGPGVDIDGFTDTLLELVELPDEYADMFDIYVTETDWSFLGNSDSGG